MDTNVAYPPYFAPLPIQYPPDTIEFTINPNESGLNGHASLTLASNGNWSFSGSFSPSNVLTGIGTFDVSIAIVVLDSGGTAFTFGASGSEPMEGTYSWNESGTNATLGLRSQFLQHGYQYSYDSTANLDLTGTINALINEYNKIAPIIKQVVDIVGPIAAALA